MYRGLFNLVKSRIPRISETELVALRSGSTSLDRDILKGTLKNLKIEFKVFRFDTGNKQSLCFQ